MPAPTTLPDLAAGIPEPVLASDSLLAGRVGDDRVLLWRDGEDWRAFSGACPHLGAPLEEGLVEGARLWCPWHHACFDLRQGTALSAPAFDDLTRYEVEVRDGRLSVLRPQQAAGPAWVEPSGDDAPGEGAPMLIVGGGAAGFAAAHGLRRRGWRGGITVISDDPHPPYDRTLLTKDYLDGTFAEDRLPIARHSLDDLDVRFRQGRAEAIEVEQQRVRLQDGSREPYGRLLLALGGEPRRPDCPGAELGHVHLLRTLDDCRGILRDLREGTRVVVFGGSFIGLEAAASLRSRGLSVELVSPDAHPLERVFGRALSDLVIGAHRDKGVVLHLGRRITAIERASVTLDDGRKIPADLVVIGIGVQPRTGLAEQAGLAVGDGILVDAGMRTSHPDIFAAGDIARWPEARGGKTLRVEHWAVAEWQGEVAAAGMLGRPASLDRAPFFWTKHFDLSIRMVGHAGAWEEIVVEGDPAGRDALLRYRAGGRDLAVATVGRDLASLTEGRRLDAEPRQGGRR